MLNLLDLDVDEHVDLHNWKGRILSNLIVRWAIVQLKEIYSIEYFVFVSKSDLNLMRIAIEYLRENEKASNINFVHIVANKNIEMQAIENDQSINMEDSLHCDDELLVHKSHGDDSDEILIQSPRMHSLKFDVNQLTHDMEAVDRLYHKIHVELHIIKGEHVNFTGEFNSELFGKLEAFLGAPRKRMFIFCVRDTRRDISNLNGARMIIYKRS